MFRKFVMTYERLKLKYATFTWNQYLKIDKTEEVQLNAAKDFWFKTIGAARNGYGS